MRPLFKKILKILKIDMSTAKKLCEDNFNILKILNIEISTAKKTHVK